MKPTVLVLGLGNDILSDDAVGLRVAEAVRARVESDAAITVRATTEMGLALLDEIVGCTKLVLVDAVQTRRAPAGHVHEVVPDEITQLATSSPHFLGVRETLALGRSLGLEMPREVRIVAIEVSDALTLGERLTPAVEAAIPQAVERVAAIARGMASM